MRRVLIALTGGPCSGKTTLAAHLGRAGAHVVPEVAIELIDELNQKLGLEGQRVWRRAHPLDFQRLVAERQGQREREALAAGPELGSLVVFDRTAVDGIAYLVRAGVPVPPEIDALARVSRPDLVFELEVLDHAFDAREATGRTSNLADARGIGEALHRAYLDYGHRPIHLPASLSVEERAARVLAEVARVR